MDGEEEPPSNVLHLRELAGQQPDEVDDVHLAMDGSETSVTWSETDRRSSQVAGALAATSVGYGSSEGLGLTVLTGEEWMQHEGSVGRGFIGAEVRILDDQGQDVPTGEIGHIFVRSPNDTGATYLGNAPTCR